MSTLKELFGSGDGAHCGISDLYPEKQAALEAAMATGQPFDTGWFSSKKEICSGRIFSDGSTITCEASCSDDFDTVGHGSRCLSATCCIAGVLKALDDALDAASDDKADNENYRGFSIHKQGRWIETLIVPTDGDDSGTPGGDYYHTWGWQREAIIPRLIRAKLRTWADKFLCGVDCGESRQVDGYTIKPWKD
jgi:hypothetical protein